MNNSADKSSICIQQYMGELDSQYGVTAFQLIFMNGSVFIWVGQGGNPSSDSTEPHLPVTATLGPLAVSIPTRFVKGFRYQI